MAATYPAMQTMYYQQPPMQMMTIAPTMPQMAIQQPLPPVTMAIAQKQVAVAPKPGVLQPAGHQQMSLTMSGHPVPPSPLNNRPPFPNRSSPLPNHPPPSFAPPQPGNQMGGAASISGIANGKQNIQRFSPY